MKEMSIRINTIEDVKSFVNTVTRYDFDVDVISGRYSIDAKSIMGLFSLDLSKVILVRIHSENCEDLVSELEKFENN